MGGMRTFAYRLEFFANSLDLCATPAAICKQPMLHFPILPSTLLHHKHLCHASQTHNPPAGDNGDRPVVGQRCARQPRQPSDLPPAPLVGALCFENTSKEAAQAGWIFENGIWF